MSCKGEHQWKVCDCCGSRYCVKCDTNMEDVLNRGNTKFDIAFAKLTQMIANDECPPEEWEDEKCVNYEICDLCRGDWIKDRLMKGVD